MLRAPIYAFDAPKLTAPTAEITYASRQVRIHKGQSAWRWVELEEQNNLASGKTHMKTHIRITFFSVFAVAALSTAVGGAMVGSKSPGKWVQESNFAQVHTRCLATFACIPATDILHGADTVVKTTLSEPVWGICNAAGGNIEGCNACSATVPNKACEYWLEKK